MAYVLDAGALVAIDRDDQTVHRLLRSPGARRTSCAVVSQVWRHGAKQARLALALRGIEVVPLDQEVDRRIGELLRDAGTSDVVDGHVALLARPGDRVVTSDPGDLGHLLKTRGVPADIHRI
jgi:PIN domain